MMKTKLIWFTEPSHAKKSPLILVSRRRRQKTTDELGLCAMQATEKLKLKVIIGQADNGDDPEVSEDHDVGLLTEEIDPELKRPPMYKVMLLNDDYTPMEFVVHILESFFGMNREKATQIMLVVHTEGAAVIGIFPRDIAETKSMEATEVARSNQYPLKVSIEQE